MSPVYFLTNNIVITQFIFLFIICNLTLLSAYHLSRQIGISKIFSVLVAILYLANPYSIIYVWRILNASIIFYAALPLIFLSLLKIGRDESVNKYILVLLFGEFLALPAFTNPVWYISFLLFTQGLNLSYILIRRSSNRLTMKKTILKYLIVSIALFLPILGFFMSVLVAQPFPLKIQASDPTSTKTQAFFYNSNVAHMDLPSLFSLTGLPPLYENHIWFNFEDIYFSNISKVVSLVVAIVIVCTFVIGGIYKKIDNKIYPFLIMFIAVLILLSSIGQIIVRNFPILLLAFRDPYQKLGSGFTLFLVILFCYSAFKIYNMKITKKYKFIRVGFSLIIAVPVIYWTTPFILGNFIPTEVKADNLHTFSAFNDAPYKYMPAIKYLKQDRDVVNGNVKVLVYPFSGSLWCEKDLLWGNDILRFSGIATVSTMSPITFAKETNFLYNLSNKSLLEDPDYVKIIGKLGIKYILLQRQPCDIDFSNLKKSELEKRNDALQNTSKIIEEKLNTIHLREIMENQLGEEKLNTIHLREIMENEYYSLFEVGTNVSSISLIREQFFDPIIINKINFLNSTSNDFLRQSIQPEYKKVSSTEYMIKIKNITKPFYITLAESYDDGWKALVNGKNQIPDKYHFIVSDFANGWYIDKTGYFSIKLYYQPQKYYEFGFVISAIMLCFCLLYLSYNERKKLTIIIRGYVLRGLCSVRWLTRIRS